MFVEESTYNGRAVYEIKGSFLPKSQNRESDTGKFERDGSCLGHNENKRSRDVG